MKSSFRIFAMLLIIMAARSLNAPVCRAADTLFEDDFKTLDPSWGDASDNKFAKAGKLVLTPSADKNLTVINQANVFDDMDATVTVRIAKTDDPTQGGGLVFWAKDSDDYDLFSVTPDGRFAVSRWVNERWLYPVAWRKSDAIKKPGEANVLRVVTKDTQATLYINGQEVATFKGQPPKGGGLIGFSGDSPETSQAVYEFSELKIVK